MRKLKTTILLLIGFIALISCTDSYFDNSFESKAETEKAIACINNAVSYTKRNESKMLFLTSRNYKWNDLKYGLSRRLTHKGNLMLQVPIIKGKLVSADIRERLSGEANRGYVLFVFDHAGRVTTVDYVEQIPSSDYRKAHDGELYYSDFEGVQDEYNEQGEYLGYYNVRRAMSRIGQEGEDTIPADSSIIDGGELPGGEVVAPYPPTPSFPDNPYPDIAEEDTTKIGDACIYCGSILEYDETTQSTYCPVCGHGGTGGNDGAGGGNSGPHSGITSGNNKYTVENAVAYIKSKAYPKYSEDKCGNCARAVRLALERGGIDTRNHPNDAKDYGPYLMKWGFKVVSPENYTPQVGDIRVFGPVKEGAAGHIDMYGGDTWYSDYKEGDYPGPKYKNVPYVIYRK